MIVVMKQLDTYTSRKEILKLDSIQYMNPSHDTGSNRTHFPDLIQIKLFGYVQLPT